MPALTARRNAHYGAASETLHQSSHSRYQLERRKKGSDEPRTALSVRRSGLCQRRRSVIAIPTAPSTGLGERLRSQVKAVSLREAAIRRPARSRSASGRRGSQRARPRDSRGRDRRWRAFLRTAGSEEDEENSQYGDRLHFASPPEAGRPTHSEKRP